MASRNGAAPACWNGGGAPNPYTAAKDTATAEASASSGGIQSVHPELGTRVEYACPVCGGGNADATYKRGRDGEPRWFVSCLSTSCPRGAAYLDALGESLELGPGRTPEELAGAVRRIGRGTRRPRDGAPLPSTAKIEGWAHRLLASPEPLRYLTHERGISPGVLRRAWVGWGEDWRGRPRLLFPIFAPGGDLVSIKVREPRSGAQMMSWPGQELRALYPAPKPAWRWVLLVAGEIDALRGRTAGLPAVSVTRGAGQWHDDWTEQLRGLRVVVCFDLNEDEQARATVARLKGAGIHPRRLDLRKLGLDTPKGDLSDYLNGGGAPERLRSAVRPRLVKRGRA